MKNDERDELLRRQTDAMERQARLTSEVVDVLGRPEREKQQRLHDAHRRPPRRLLHGRRGLGVMAAALPGFGELWTQAIPDSHVLKTTGRDGEPYRIVLCPCGAQSILTDDDPLVQCRGGAFAGDELDPTLCPRFFLATEDDVRVHRFATAAAA